MIWFGLIMVVVHGTTEINNSHERPPSMFTPPPAPAPPFLSPFVKAKIEHDRKMEYSRRVKSQTDYKRLESMMNADVMKPWQIDMIEEQQHVLYQSMVKSQTDYKKLESMKTEKNIKTWQIGMINEQLPLLRKIQKIAETKCYDDLDFMLDAKVSRLGLHDCSYREQLEYNVWKAQKETIIKQAKGAFPPEDKLEKRIENIPELLEVQKEKAVEAMQRATDARRFTIGEARQRVKQQVAIIAKKYKDIIYKQINKTYNDDVRAAKALMIEPRKAAAAINKELMLKAVRIEKELTAIHKKHVRSFEGEPELPGEIKWRTQLDVRNHEGKSKRPETKKARGAGANIIDIRSINGSTWRKVRNIAHDPKDKTNKIEPFYYTTVAALGGKSKLQDKQPEGWEAAKSEMARGSDLPAAAASPNSAEGRPQQTMLGHTAGVKGATALNLDAPVTRPRRGRSARTAKPPAPAPPAKAAQCEGEGWKGTKLSPAILAACKLNPLATSLPHCTGRPRAPPTSAQAAQNAVKRDPTNDPTPLITLVPTERRRLAETSVGLVDNSDSNAFGLMFVAILMILLVLWFLLSRRCNARKAPRALRAGCSVPRNPSHHQDLNDNFSVSCYVQ